MLNALLIAGLALAATLDDADEPKRCFGLAQRLFKQAKYSEAIAQFEEAYRLKPHPAILFNIGRCHQQLGDVPRALRSFRDYLRAMPDAADREEVSAAIRTLEGRLAERGLGQLLVYADLPGARIEVDGRQLGVSPAAVELAPGPHRLMVTCEGFAPVHREFVMPSEGSEELFVRLEAQAPPAAVNLLPPQAPASAPKAAVALSPPRRPEPRPEVVSGRLWTYLAAGASGVGLATGAGLGLSAQSASNELLRTAHSRDEAQRLRDQAAGAATAANVAYGTAVVTGAAAIVLYFVEPRLAAGSAATF
ncbi:MAG: tetratricopeptide repeat protein [Myxococcaceae bacterium]